MRDLDDDYYEFDEKNYCLRGRRKNRMYSLGDAITVKVARNPIWRKAVGFCIGRRKEIMKTIIIEDKERVEEIISRCDICYVVLPTWKVIRTLSR